MEAMDPKWDHHKIAFNKDMIAFFAKEKTPPDFAPGTKCQYSNTGYVLLASIIEKVSGQDLNDFLQSRIFHPLNMQRSRIYNTRRSKRDTIPDYAYGFVQNDSLHRYVMPDSLPEYDQVYYLDGIKGDGVVNSTTGDLLKWDRALKESRLLSKKLQQDMFAPHALLDSVNLRYYGYGEMSGKNELGPFIMHTGGWPGYATVLTRYTDQDLTLIVLSNNESNSSRLAGAIAYILNGKPVTMPYEHRTVPIDSSLPAKYAGNYSIEAVPKDIPLRLIAKNGKLYRHLDGKEDLELKPESSTTFYYPNQSDQQIEFTSAVPANANNAPIAGYFIVGGMKKLLKRVGR
jgi:CubicO group peptidase (beta-lactamase class C family)